VTPATHTYHLCHLVVHLVQFVTHGTTHYPMGVTSMVHTQVVTNDHIPVSRAPQQRHQVL
jgi:hypothetical protein